MKLTTHFQLGTETTLLLIWHLLTTAQEGQHISMLKLYACQMGGHGTSLHSDLNFYLYKIQAVQQLSDCGRSILVLHHSMRHIFTFMLLLQDWTFHIGPLKLCMNSYEHPCMTWKLLLAFVVNYNNYWALFLQRWREANFHNCVTLLHGWTIFHAKTTESPTAWIYVVLGRQCHSPHGKN